jgi:hypothetical protein
MDIYKKLKIDLIAEFADLLTSGFPEQETAQYDTKVAELPEEQRKEVEELTKLSETLKSALTGRDYYRSRTF